MTHPPINEQITFLYTRDIGKTASFYEEIMGLSLALDQGGCRIYRVAGDKGYLGICERDYAPQKPQGVIFTIVTHDVDGWYHHLVEKGVVCDGPPRLNETYGIYHFFLHDPNGYLLEIQRFTENPWDKTIV